MIDGFLLMFAVIALAIILLLTLFFNFIPVGLWISAVSAGVKVSIWSLVGMRLRRVKPARVINPLIKGIKAGLNVSQNQLESHLLSGGRVNNVVDALIAAHRANMELTFERAAAIDLAGRDVFEAVRMSVMPKIIETPMISAMAVNGIEIKAMAKVTVRANIARLVGGAGEDTIIARVGEGIVTTIGSAKSHSEVLENPDRISQTVLNKGLDSGTAYEILSIDIADIDVGRNIGAHLQIDQAEADKQIAQAKAEERRATAFAAEQEMRARVEEMRSKVVEAEAQVPQAIAEALRNGNMGVMDYLGMQNKIADTKMREGLAGININMTTKPDDKA
ncbi:MAG: flotillin-like protein FloA [Defluviitaleaceae bacterium]|nr:flotillin-like protein FloA [Defluviitaleaceae bacterium]